MTATPSTVSRWAWLSFWRYPLKLCVLCYFLGDTLLLAGGLEEDNMWMAAAGLLGNIGNAFLLIGGDGREDHAHSAVLYERIAFALFTTAAFFFVTSGFIGYGHGIVWGDVMLGCAEFAGSATGLLLSSEGRAGSFARLFFFMQRRDWSEAWHQLRHLRPYQISAFCYFILTLSIGVSYLETGNNFYLLAFVAFLLSDYLLAISHRAERKQVANR